MELLKDLQEIELEEKKKLIELRKRYTIIGSVGLLIKEKDLNN